MTVFVLVIVLALSWTAITGSLTVPNLLLGMAIAALAVLLLRRSFAPPKLLRRLGRIGALALLFFRELAVSAVRVAIVVLSPDPRSQLRPAIVAFPLRVTSDAEIALLANLITLTPGTLSVDVSDDRRLLYIHVLDLASKDALVADIAQGFETRIREVFE